MQYVIQEPTSKDTIDTSTGLSTHSNGGSELMYRSLMQGLGEQYTNKFQFISSRVRELEPDKKKILILNDTWDDPESAHLKDPKSRERFEKLVFVSNYQFNTYNMALGVPFDKSVVMRNAIVPIEDHVKQSPEFGVKLIYHTTPHRGLELLIPVFLELVNLRPNVHLDVYSSFNIYGWPQRDAPYEKLFDICKNHDHITYHGSVPNAQIREALKQAHIFAYPSIWPETSCIAAIEAMSAGCAVVAPDFAALPETLGSYGYVYRWTENITDHMNRFGNYLLQVIDNISNSHLQENLTFGQRYVKSQFNIQTRIHEWKSLLDNLDK